MANPEHLKILKQGVDRWNQWLKEYPKIKPDLTRADLSGANLNLADLTRADLSGANLGEAKLQGVNLFQANISRTDLSGVDFSLANFTRADLSGANLSKTRLIGTNFNSTNLNKADFTKAFFSNTIFADVDLSLVKGLESCRYFGPCSIDQLTLIKSGKLPESFLRDCGFPDQFIENLPSLVGSLNPIDFYSCFISHSVKDEKFAKQLHSDLQAAGIRCWYAPEDLKTGQKIRKEIHEAIRIHDKLLLVLSKNSIDSDWVEEEVETAIQQEASRRKNNQDDLVLFPIRLDDAVMDSQVSWAEKVRTRHIADFRKWKKQDSREEAFKRLLSDLKNESNNGK